MYISTAAFSGGQTGVQLIEQPEACATPAVQKQP
jgi:hypothetical protein